MKKIIEKLILYGAGALSVLVGTVGLVFVAVLMGFCVRLLVEAFMLGFNVL